MSSSPIRSWVSGSHRWACFCTHSLVPLRRCSANFYQAEYTFCHPICPWDLIHLLMMLVLKFVPWLSLSCLLFCKKAIYIPALNTQNPKPQKGNVVLDSINSLKCQDMHLRYMSDNMQSIYLVFQEQSTVEYLCKANYHFYKMLTKSNF